MIPYHYLSFAKRISTKIKQELFEDPEFFIHLFTSFHALIILNSTCFQISSLSTADPITVEDYLDAFEEISTNLLEYIVNMRDGAVRKF